MGYAFSESEFDLSGKTGAGCDHPVRRTPPDEQIAPEVSGRIAGLGVQGWPEQDAGVSQ